jgi:hypothetical protein
VLHVAPVEVQPVAFLHPTSGQVEFGIHDEPTRHVASHRHEVLQWMPPLQAPLSHATEHEPVPQVTPVGHAPGPQFTEQADDVEQSTPPPHAPTPQVTVHGAEPHRTPVGHAPASQVIEQLDAAEQSTVPRQESPVQWTTHCPAPQVTSFGHDPVPEHETSQLDACVQSTVPLHAPTPQLIRHGTPGGQRVPLRQLDGAEQSRTQTAPSQLPPVQAARQAVMAASDGAPSGVGGASGGTEVSPTDESVAVRPPVVAPPPPPAPLELAS